MENIVFSMFTVGFLSSLSLSYGSEHNDSDIEELLSSGFSGDLDDLMDMFTKTVGKYGCKEAYRVAYWLAPPYTRFDSLGSIVGLLPDLLFQSVSKCCEADVKVVFQNTDRYVGNDYMLRYWENESFAVPVFRTSQQQLFEPVDHYTFYPVFETNGVVLLKNSNENTLAKDTLNAMVGTWPLLAIVLLSAAFAGIIMWALDTYKNPEDFPRKFPNGCWEGFWWAFVTMSTVGYGDKAPKSIVGKLFSIVWILVGLIVLSLFTASMTTALTAGQLEANNIKGKKIGVMAYSMEYKKALSMGSIPIEFFDTEEMFKAVSNGTLFGCLMEQYSWIYAEQKNVPQNIYWATDFEEKGFIGILAPKGENALFPSDRQICLSKSILKDRYEIASIFGKDMVAQDSNKKTVASETTSDIFEALSVKGLLIGLGIWVLTYSLILGFYCLVKTKVKKNVVKDVPKVY